ncbi:MAG: regulatory protein MarR [Geminicoccaceae bacterium]|jgi:DNA-binding MarR family transcriptional regulator|nr:regulatory protein MarR [Geminicoccaceae bacterium]
MVISLQEEIKQTKPFASLAHEAHLSVVRTAAVVQDEVERFLKPYGITATQYNVLRILRGAEPDGLCRNEVRDRMLTRMPDMTRLLDRMEEAGLVGRSRERDDRRMVLTRISAQGRKLLSEIDVAVEQEHKSRFAKLSDDELRFLIEILAKVRSSG